MDTAQLDQIERVSLTARYAKSTPSEAAELIDDKWEAAERFKNFVKDEVSTGNLEPVEAGRILACTMGQLWGYQEFHSPDVLGSLFGRLHESDGN